MFVRNGQVLGSVLHSAEPNTEPAQPVDEVAPPEPESTEPSTNTEPETPPRAGAGSGRDAWAQFLRDQNIPFADGDKDAGEDWDGRDDLIDLWDNREVNE